MFDDGLAMHTAGLKTGFGKAATYQQGSKSVNLTAVWQGDRRDREYVSRLADTPEATTFVLLPPEQGYCGFLVAVADLAAAGISQPERGDKILIGSDTYTLEAPDGLFPWRYADLPFKTWFWCHTKLG